MQRVINRGSHNPDARGVRPAERGGDLGHDLGGADPVAFCRHLRDDARTREIRVVVVGGAAGALRRRALREAGAAALLASPFGPLELLETVETLAHGRAELRVGAKSE